MFVNLPFSYSHLLVSVNDLTHLVSQREAKKHMKKKYIYRKFFRTHLKSYCVPFEPGKIFEYRVDDLDELASLERAAFILVERVNEVVE